MVRPDVKIGEQIFRPKESGLGGKIRQNVLYGVALVWADLNYPLMRQYLRVRDELKLGVFYGHEAAQAFAESLRPKVRSTTELQRIRQSAWFNHPNPHPRPIIDPDTGNFAYRFETHGNSQVLTPIFPD